ncbi:MAG: PEP-CTERM sorting domain-containing protein, partial [Deltaproteobacteria bacterium]|nr:PEP-CTERM sorting domain-containing protein [Deltaproteobacteria bacterium]
GCSSTGLPAPTSLAWIGLLSGMVLVARRRRK